MAAGGEVIQAVTFANSVLNKVCDVIMRDKSMKGAVKRGLSTIKLEMKMVITEIKLNEEKNQGATHESKIVLLKELAYDIEDFIDRMWVPRKSALVLSALGLDPRTGIVQKIEHFKDSIQRVRSWQPDAVGSSNGQDGAATWSPCRPSASATPPNPYSKDLDDEDTFRSICRHRSEMDMLLSASQGQELKVISIVGCRGVGKTSLARAVYDDCRARAEYGCVAWVVASECRDLEDLLTKLLKEAQSTAKPTSTAAQGSISDTEQTSLRNFLSDKRYFVVIDDVDRLEVCEAIKREFPKDCGHSSRIIVTTSRHSVAAECSSGSHVYTMQCLDKVESEEVFKESVGQENQTPALLRASEGIIKKCGGLPLALISVANFLRRRGQTESRVAGGLTTDHCKSTACTLGDKILKGQDAEFLEINRALLQCYNNLPDHDHQSCLLYASVFPRGRPINSKVLLRRWMSEGTVNCNEESVKSCLEAFIERCIVEPVEIKNARVARCKVHSIMLEFIIHKAVSKKFVALLDNDELLSNNGTAITNVRVRRLSVQDSTKQGVDDAVCPASGGIDLSVMRSLTIFGSPLLNLIQACELLRVLDLEGCKGVNNDTVLKAICKQLFLKYLSLRRTDIDHLHRKIKDLVHLETLDIRDTSVQVVPIEVIRLPLLAHLFGRFELPHGNGITQEISKQSKLQTLAGVVVTEAADKSFENILLHARKLRKVKICQATSYNSSNSRNRSRSISSALKERFTGSKALQIISIDSSDLSKELISFLKAPCAITSIKLRGQLDRLPATPTLGELSDLNRLLLISTGLSIEDLSALQSLPCLEYLKLAEEHGFRGRSFVVKSGGFPSLRRLCFEAPRLPQVQIQQGSMESLTILDLLCPGPVIPERRHCCLLQLETSLGVEGVSYLENLKEVILHHSMRELEVHAWKEEALRHNKKPSVKRQPQPQPTMIHAA